jgi:hypothetical protein
LPFGQGRVADTEKAINFALLFLAKAENRAKSAKRDTFLFLLIDLKSGRYSSGQRGQTVNLLTYVFTGSNPVLPTNPFVDLMIG